MRTSVLLVELGDGVHSLGPQPNDAAYASQLRPVPLAKPVPATGGPRVAAVVRHHADLHLRGLASDGVTPLELGVPGTTEMRHTCFHGGYVGVDGSCEGSCQELGVGLIWDAYAAAETSDGRLWVAWVETELDQEITYTKDCSLGVPELCECVATVVSDASTGRVHLVVSDPALTSATEVLVLPTPGLAPLELLATPNPPVQRNFEMRAFGTTLTLATRERGSPDDSARLRGRVVMLDTTKL